jgi:UDP-2,3-diacylglucosamine pyrophosphatase LpxH
MKLATPTSARYIDTFEQAAVRHAHSQGYDGIICGHIHRAKLCRMDGLVYANTGDWVESCSALVEERTGDLQLLRWPYCQEPSVSVASQWAGDYHFRREPKSLT